ncbi:tripartite motif-containing protein 45-like [Dendronephthya gigantea]|uniref:tripartite motif-containing protein 45-like n=1 Tax=Dendronephthya gigantea TaxID=151771 RepID=UPI00106D8E08|nr:tripartite motif-containing protein 45-like [Dendronephthya gigantea]
MAESLRSQFEEHLRCAICLEQLKDPKVLPCLHSYCHDCIAKLDMKDGVLNCPECRTTVEVPNPPDVSFLPTNFFAKNLLATVLLAAESNSGDIICENCDSKELPETRCRQCTRYLCKFCTEAHKRFRDTKNHTLSTLDELKDSKIPVITETDRCPKHEDEVLKLYCNTCQETICRDCIIIDHHQHDFVFARDVFQKKKDELFELVGEVNVKKSEFGDNLAYLKEVENNFHEGKVNSVKKIHEYFEGLGDVLEKEKNKYLEEAEILNVGKIKQLHVKQEELELNIASCESAVEFTQRAFSNGNDVQILNLTKYMTQCLENLKNGNADQRSCTGEKIEVNEYSDLYDRMVQFRLIDFNDDSPDNFIATLTSPLTVSEKAEVVIKRKDPNNSIVNNSKIAMIPCFQDIAVKDVSIEDRDDGSRAVRFTPLQCGTLTLVTYMNGSSQACLTATAMVHDKIASIRSDFMREYFGNRRDRRQEPSDDRQEIRRFKGRGSDRRR